MREELLSSLLCPLCKSSRLEIAAVRRDEREIREGSLSCQDCRGRFPIEKGIVDLLPDPSPTIRSERAGWAAMGEENKRAKGGGDDPEEVRIARMWEMPYLKDRDPVWITVADNFDRVMAQVDLARKRVLDLGAGRCWSSRRMALAGASFVSAWMC